MRGNGRLPGFLAVIAACALAGGGACKKDDERASEQEPAAKTSADPAGGAAAPTAGTGVVGEALIKHVDECWRLIESWDKAALGNCSIEKPDVTYVDAVLGPPKASTRNELVVAAGTFRNEYSEFKAERSLILVNGNKAVAVVLISGKHRSGKPISTFQVEVSEHDAEGRTTRVEYYREEATIMHQLGVLESASAPSSEKPWGAPVRQVARNDDTERGNVDLVKKEIDALGKGDVGAAQAMYADDAVLRYVPEGRPYIGAADIKARLDATVQAKVKLALRDAWAAGDWVVAKVTSSGTAEPGGPGGKGSKGKNWELNSLELFKFEGGKAKQHWIFTNSIKWARDVGQFDPSMVENQ